MKKFIVFAVIVLTAFCVFAHGSKEKNVQSLESEVVKQLYDQFDSSMKAQLGEVKKPTGKEKFGALIISMTNPFWSNMKDCYESAAKKLGVKMDVKTGTTEGDTNSQLDVLMTMADMGYDLIFVSPIDGTNLIPGIIKCNKNGVKVINLGPGVDTNALHSAGGYLDGKITVNFAEQGETVAKDMMDRLSGGAEVACLQGISGAGQSEGRTKGFVDAIKQNKNYKLVASVPCDWDATKAYDTTKDILTKNPNVKGIFACNDVMALASVEALNNMGKKDVLVYGVDYTNDAKQAMKEGTMCGSMSYSSKKYCEAALSLGINLLQNVKYDNPVYLPLTLVTKDNVLSMESFK